MTSQRKKGDDQSLQHRPQQSSVSMRLAKYQNPSLQMHPSSQMIQSQMIQPPQMSPTYQQMPQGYQQSFLTTQIQPSQTNYTENRQLEKRGAADRATTTCPTLLVGSSHSAVVTHIENGPLVFSIQLQTSIDEVLPSITSILNEYSPISVSSPLLPGINVMGKCLETSKMRRCCIVAVSETTCSVYYIDYGNLEELPHSNIYQLPPYALEIAPPMALRFALANLNKILINQETKDYFSKLVLNKKVHIIVTEREGPIYHYCDMYYNGQNVRDLLINMNSPLEYTNQFPPRGREMSVIVSYVDSPTQFFVQYETEMSILEQIKEGMKYLSVSQSGYKNIDDIRIGVPVASLLKEDESWYRALVIGIDGTKVNVFFVDYGNRYNVDINQIKPMTRQIVKKWRSQAVECCLAGFENATPDPVISSLMEGMTLGQKFTLKLRSMLNGNRLSIDLINEQGQNINQIISSKAELRAEELAKQSISIPKFAPKQREIAFSGHVFNADEKICVGKRSDFEHFRSYNEHDDRCNIDEDKNNYYGGKRNDKDKKARQYDDRSGSDQSERRNSSKFRSDRPRYNNDKGSQEDKTERRFNKDRFNDKHQSADRPRNERFDRNDRFDKNDNRNNRTGRFNEDRKSFDRNDERKSRNFPKKSFGDDYNNTSNASNEMKVESWEDPVPVTSSTLALSSSVEEIITSFNKLNILEGQTIEAHFSSMNDPSDIYVQLSGSEGPLDQVRQLIESDMDNIPKREISDIVLTMPVLAVYPEDNLIYRAMVKTFPDSYNNVKVIYVDYGNSSVVPVSSLFVVTKELLSTPAQALRIKLNNVSTPQSGWPSDLDSYQDVYESYDILYINVSKVKFIDGELLVTGSVSKELSQQLKQCESKSNEKAADTVPVQPNAEFEPDIEVQPVQIQPEIQPAQIEPEVQTIQVPIIAQEPVAHEKVNPEVSDKWSGKLNWLIGQYLSATKLSEINQSIFMIDIDDIGIVHAEIQTKKKEIPEKIIIYVDKVGDDRIYVDFYEINGSSLIENRPDKCPIWPTKIREKKFKCFISHYEDDIIYIQKKEDSDKIAQLLDDLFIKYNDTKSEEIVWKKDMICSALSSDGNWYRAKIIQNETVHFIDYGNNETLTNDNLRQLDILIPELCFKIKLPGQYKLELLDYVSEEFDIQVYKYENDVFISDLFFQNGESLIDKINGKYNLDLPIDYDFEVGQKIEVTISHVDTPTTFWVQMNKDLEKIDELQEKLIKDEGENDDKVFAALYSVDNNWYRAIDINDKMVRFIDYGNIDTPIQRKSLSSELIKPRHGYSTQLYLCVQPNEKWSSEAFKLFEDFIENPLEAKIISLRYKTVVDLISDNISISDLLIKNGHGIYTETYIPEIKELPINPKINDTTIQKVFITYLRSVVHFYIQYEEQNKELEQVCGYLLKASNFKTKNTININDLVAAKFSDDTLWYRARIISKDPIKAIFIDYGNTTEVSEVRELPDELYKIPAFAIFCSLNIEDIDDYNDKFFEVLDSGETPFEVEYIKKGSPNIVTLKYYKGDNVLTKIIPEILEDKPEIPEDNPEISQDIPEILEDKPEIPQDNPEISDIQSLEISQVSLPKPDCLEVHKSCLVTHFDSLNSFYIQTTEQINALINFSKNIKPDEHLQATDVKIGDLVLAKFSENIWYRARIVKLPNTVLLIDYGNICESNDLKQLNDTIPPYCFQCQFIKCEEMSQEAYSSFKSMLDLDISFDIHVYEIPENQPRIVDLYIEGNSLSEKLIKLKKPETIRKGHVCFYENLNKFFIRDDTNNEINFISSKLSTSIPIHKTVKIGDLIASIDPKDNTWYRSLVLQTEPIRVYFIDFGGESEVVQISELSEELLSISPLCTQVCFKRSDGSSWPETIKDIAGDILSQYNLTVYESVSNGIKKTRIDIDEIGDASEYFEQIIQKSI